MTQHKQAPKLGRQTDEEIVITPEMVALFRNFEESNYPVNDPRPEYAGVYSADDSDVTEFLEALLVLAVSRTS